MNFFGGKDCAVKYAQQLLFVYFFVFSLGFAKGRNRKIMRIQTDVDVSFILMMRIVSPWHVLCDRKRFALL